MRRQRSRRWTASSTAGALTALVAVLVVVTMVWQPWSHGPAAASSSLTSVTPTASSRQIVLTASPSPTRSASSSPSPAKTTAKAASAANTATATATAADPATSTAESAAPAGFRTVTFVNEAGQTIWVAGYQQTAQPALGTTGWVLPAGQSLNVPVPDKWNGRFWGRTGCSFSASGSGHCQTGDCGGLFQCKGYGVIPATLAEFNLNAWDGLDFYDVSMVDGSNLPMYINISAGGTKDPISSTGCIAAGCTKPVVCPAALSVDGGAGCESACGVFDTDQYCCRGQWASRAACQPAQWPVDYATVFKQAEPYAYSYTDDDATSVFTCTGNCDYRITFGTTP